ncbi:acyl-CoA thioesterase [Ruminococcus sp.]|uniref:acyl-CoA thioesterase n=1 Tax=Ruminococcus sp. TaxID=41978 RepID=UPI0025D33EA9|nr:acyl-CoA thioesterase [Ruminococcus sp.]MBQ6252286.1 acyl-CoA thioesterase [Ruminococcus sp.]
MTEIKPLERKVNYYETDKMGIVHHSNYIRIFEETRVHYLAEMGMPFENIEAAGVLMPVLSVECSYKHPLVFGEAFQSSIRVTKFNGTTLHLAYRVISLKTGDLCAEGTSSHCFTDTDLKPIRTKNKFPDIYNVFNELTAAASEG